MQIGNLSWTYKYRVSNLSVRTVLNCDKNVIIKPIEQFYLFVIYQ